MFERRLNVESQMRKPNLVLDDRFAFVKDLQLKDKGNIIALVEMTEEELRMDGNGNEIKHFTLKLLKAKQIFTKTTRV